VSAGSTRITGNDYGVFLFDGAEVAGTDLVVSGNRKKDRYSGSLRTISDRTEYVAPTGMMTPRRYGDDVLLGETVWQGKIVISGIVRVPENSRLVVLPGTVVEFHRKDTTGSGIGENGLLIQGRFIAKGTPKQPIFFRSAEKERRPGDWDAINIMNSDGAPEPDRILPDRGRVPWAPFPFLQRSGEPVRPAQQLPGDAVPGVRR
jgi:hypothetical protein